ncbi:MAG TPA: response regulator transcription factor [Streptosporangiaceae bacterium]
MKVLIVDDHPIARRGLRMVLSEAFGETECAEAADAAAALTMAADLRPDLLLLDMHMPGDLAAPALCSLMRAALPDAKIVIVTAFERSDDIRACLEAGADGCLLKDTSEVDMAVALRAALTGGSALDSRVAFRLARELASNRDHTSAIRLSGREWQVLHLLAEGCSNRAIARRLELSEATVKGHVSSLLDKLNASSRLQAVVRASDAGLI